MYIEQWYDAEKCYSQYADGKECDATAEDMEWDDEVGVWCCTKCGEIY